MSKYNDYGDFMIAVLDEANEMCGRNAHGTLASFFGLSKESSKVLQIIAKILGISWPSFVAICSLLILGPIAFIAALAAFISGGVGAVIIAALAIYGGVKAIKLLYQHKFVPLKVYEVGKKYKDRFYNNIDNHVYIDGLISKAAFDLLF